MKRRTRRRRRNPAKSNNALLYVVLGVAGYLVLSSAVPALGLPNPLTNSAMGGDDFGLNAPTDFSDWKERLKIKINGNHRDVKKAAKLYQEFREAKPKRGRVVEMELPKTLMIMGNVQFVGYDTTRRGKTELYKHDFAPGSRPLICADPKSGQLFLIGGRYHVTERGIVDIDARGKEIDD
jgi:hypothetical protein